MSTNGWITKATENKGGLHKALKVPESEIIPKSKINKAAHGDNPKVAKEARLAETLGRLNARSNGGCV